MNPLVESCANLSRLGYSDSDEVSLPWHDSNLVNLGRYLLNNSGLPRVYHPKPKEAKHKHVAICFGGGIDSYCALFHALTRGYTVTVVAVNYGHPYWQAEYDRAIKIVRTFGQAFSADIEWDHPFVLDFRRVIKDYGMGPETINFSFQECLLLPGDSKLDLSWKNYIIPGRNLVLAAIGSEFASEVWILATKRADETIGTPDKTTAFYRLSSAVFTSFWNRRVRVTSPFLNQSKLEVVQEYLKQGGSVDALKATFSCYDPPNPDDHCGTCYACYKRFKLFQALNVEFNFRTHPNNGPNFHDYAAKERAKGR